MLDEGLRRRLEALNRNALPSEGVETVARSIPTVTANVPGKRNIAPPVVGLLRRGEVVPTGAGEHLRIRLPIDELWPNGSKLVTGRHDLLREQLADAQRAVEPTLVMDAEFAAFVAALPERALLLDLETCGLGGSALFLAGVLRHVDGALTVELLLARDYSEEQAVLESLWQVVAGHDVLLTFNGKSFDWPMFVDRSIRHRLAAARCCPQLRHIDLLHHARRRWRKLLPDCRLQTLEQLVCRRGRSGDIPGHRIPAAYADFVRTGFERDMDLILYHNAMDLVTLLDLALRLAG